MPQRLWAHGYISDANGPNCNQTYGDDVRNCADIYTAVGATDANQGPLIKLGMSCTGGAIGSRPRAACTTAG